MPGRNKLRGNFYDPLPPRIVLQRGAPAYARFHEMAHALQHAEFSCLFILAVATRFIPWVRRLTRLALELDADLRARVEMTQRGIWNRDAQRDSCSVLGRYLLFLLIP